MNDNIDGKVSEVIENLKIEVREIKELGKSPGKILDMIGNDCYIYSALEEVGVSNFNSLEQARKILEIVKQEVAKEIVINNTDKLQKCDYSTQRD